MRFVSFHARNKFIANKKVITLQDNLLFELYIQVLFQILYTNSAQL